MANPLMTATQFVAEGMTAGLKAGAPLAPGVAADHLITAAMAMAVAADAVAAAETAETDRDLLHRHAGAGNPLLVEPPLVSALHVEPAQAFPQCADSHPVLAGEDLAVPLLCQMQTALMPPSPGHHPGEVLSPGPRPEELLSPGHHPEEPHSSVRSCAVCTF